MRSLEECKTAVRNVTDWIHDKVVLAQTEGRTDIFPFHGRRVDAKGEEVNWFRQDYIPLLSDPRHTNGAFTYFPTEMRSAPQCNYHLVLTNHCTMGENPGLVTIEWD